MSRFLRAGQDVSNGVRNIIFPLKIGLKRLKIAFFFLKGLRPSRSDLGPISERTPPSVWTRRPPPERCITPRTCPR